LTRQGILGILSVNVSDRRPIAPRTVAQNIIAEHGKPAFQKLIAMFRANESGTKIGHVFSVSRQRINQWKAALGSEHVTYVLDPAIEDLVEKKSPRTTRRTAV
jgi:hypothetical protein